MELLSYKGVVSMSNVGDVIRVLRKKRGYSQAQLADAMGLRRSAIGNYERGIREPDLDTIEAFADFFDVSVSDLMGREEPNYRYQFVLTAGERRLIAAYRLAESYAQKVALQTLENNPSEKKENRA